MQNSRTTEDVAHGIRCRVFEHSMRNNGGYLSQACSAAEQLAFLYNEALNLGPSTMPLVPPPFGGVPSAANHDYRTGAGYNGPFDAVHDRLFIAPAHYALVAYACLIEVGRMAPEGLEMFNQDGSSVEMIGAEHSPGMEVHNGTLGIGLSTGAGLAWGRKRRGETGEVCVYMSDGEVQEGQTWEAVQAAAHHGIDNLWALMDVNRQQCDGAMDSVMTVGDIATKFRNFGAVVAEVDAHDLTALREARATPHEGQPLIILAHSSPTKGMEFLMKRFPRLHYVRFKSDEERREMNIAIAAELGIAPVDLGGH
ncbi:transketolase [Paracoccus sp. IB05]|uniref:transketolase n=1 Tax=Paracoccus sp. IB05 TaxID=2779367 RepID=UPI0018E8CE27|nr:transketolase [Paracoccus sp. IB05]MBJ2150010.1 transketolase [Paracoccus sp. IB05]